MAHYVTCIYCGERFNRDKDEFIQVSSKRYAHKECHEKAQEKLTKEEKDKKALEDYIIKNLKVGYITPRIRKQLKEYVEKYKYTYSGILKALVYFYEVKGNSFEKANGGLGIVPYIYTEAYHYYYSIWLANQKNELKLKKQMQKPQTTSIFIKIPTVERKKRKRFSFLEEDYE